VQGKASEAPCKIAGSIVASKRTRELQGDLGPIINFSYVLLQAGKHSEAVKLLTEQAQKLTAAKGSPLHIKQLHVLAALEVDAFRKQALQGAGGDSSTAAATLLNSGKGGPGATSSMVTGAAAPTAAAQTLAGKA
jgi:hypothetical protein